MNNYVVEQYLIYFKEKPNSKTCHYLIKKFNTGNIIISFISGKVRKDNIKLDDINNSILLRIIDKYYKILSIANLKYSEKYIGNTLIRTKNLNILEYANAKECEYLSDNKIIIRVVKYYYNAKGRMFTKLIGHEW
ncbi:MAG: hypothetical protein ACI4ON_04690 [Clostridia bacterium]